MTNVAARAVELVPEGFPVLRGTRWGGEPATLLLHAPGGDLDDWRDLPLLLAHRTGFGAVALDLPGHGLSDDPAVGEGNPLTLTDLLRAVASTADRAGVRVVVAAGETALAALNAAPDLALAGIVCLSPALPEATAAAVARSPRVPKLFVAWNGSGAAVAGTRALAGAVGGWAAVSILAGPGPGRALLDGPSGAQARDQIVGFVRQCLLRPARGGQNR